MADRRIHLTPILLEAFFVVLGVSLALLGNEWRTNANARAHAAHARQTIVEEARTNRATTRHSYEYHGRLLDSLRVYFPPEHGAPSPGLFSEGFFHPATALTTAWDAANATDAVSHLDYEEVLAFSKLYAMQERYERTAMNAGSVIYAEIMRGGVPGVTANYRNLSYLIGAFYYLERELLAEYDRVLETIGEVDPDSSTTP